jgi:DNA-binding protein HU-beta
MNKAELIQSLETRLGSKKAASDALEAVVDAIIREVAKGNKVGITGFGTFEKISRAARTGRNPRTGTTVRIKKTAVPKFKPGTAFKAVVANPRSLPKSGNAGGRASTAAAAAPAKKTAAKKATAKKATAKKTTAKKATPAKAAAKKTTAKKTTAKKTTAKKTTAKRASRR